MLDTIKLKARMVSLESITPEQTLTASTERLPEFISDVRTFLSTLFSSKAKLGKCGADGTLLRQVNALKIGDFVTTHVVCPPGLTVHFQQYLSVLQDFASGDLNNLINSVLKPYHQWLGIILTNPETLASFKNDKSINHLKLTDVTAIKTTIDDCFTQANGNAVMSFTTAYRNLSEYKSVNEGIDKLIQQVERIDEDEVARYVKDIDERLALLVERLTSGDAKYGASGNTIKTLASVSYAIASECEFFAVYRYQVMTFATAIKDGNIALAEQIKKIAK